MAYVPDEVISKFLDNPDITTKDLEGLENAYGNPASPRTARRWLAALQSGNIDFDDEPEELEENDLKRVEDEYSLTVTSKSETIKTVEDLERVCEIDTKLWRCERCQVTTSQAQRKSTKKDLCWSGGKLEGYVIDDGEFNIVTLYSVKAHFVRREEAPFEEVMDRLVERMKVPYVVPPVKPSYPGGNHLLVPGTSDVHFTRLSLDGSYTPEQTKEDMAKATDAIIARTLGLGIKVEQILFPVGNDLLDVDNTNGTTTRGTWQQTCANVRDGIDAIVESHKDAIEKYVRIAPVHVKLVPGNHDQLAIYWLGKVLEAYFANHKYSEQIVIDNSKTFRKYYQYGQNLIGMEHGDRVSAKDLALIMAEESGCFDTTKFRTFLRGHFHKEKGMFTPIADTGAVHVVTYPAFCPQNSWELLMGYLGGNRAAEARFFHKEHGPAGVFPIFIDEL